MKIPDFGGMADNVGFLVFFFSPLKAENLDMTSLVIHKYLVARRDL